MVIVNCPASGCSYTTPDEDPAVIAALLNIHALSHQSQTSAQSKGPRLDRPRIDVGVDQETWNAFRRRWEAFKNGSGINDASAPTQLFQCASDALGDLLLRADPDITSRSIVEILEAMRKLAVIPTALGVIRAELMQMKQSPDENFRTFAARVKGKAETCAFSIPVSCQCGRTINANYTEDASCDVLIAGIADIDIRREALNMESPAGKSVNNVTAFVEGREMARNATPVSSFSTISSFKKSKAHAPTNDRNQTLKTPDIDRTRTAMCPDCGEKFRPYKQKNGAWNSKPHTLCIDCWRSKHRRAVQSREKSSEISTMSTNQISQVSALTLRNNILTKGEWRNAQFADHPKVSFELKIRGRSTTHTTTVVGLADTGAQSNLWGLREFEDAGFTKENLETVKIDIRAANKNPINIIGAFRGQLSGNSPSGEKISCWSTVYVSDSVTGFYLSYDTMLDLNIIDRCFPTIGSCDAETPDVTNSSPRHVGPHQCNDRTSHVRALNAGCSDHDLSEGSCSCPQRSAVPIRPTQLPFKPTAENNQKMRQWLLDRYGSSTFNTCPHRPLPCMTGPPVEIHIDDSAHPRTCHTAAPIPMHWQNQVHQDLLRDEALGVIEKVPYGEPVTWCHRMVVTRKHNGSPRRTVDLSPLNKFCKRETFAAEAPFHLARRVPGNTWKTVTDAWNGYHSVPLRDKDRHLTTFITPFGRWRYTRAPQGFLSSGDGYNRRFDQILSDFQRKERCVDDTIHFDTDLEEHWWRTIDFLSTVGSAGVVLNPDKFQFAQREAEFAGFRITENTIQPLPKYIEAIRSFPTPESTTDIRSWFGLVNQVANYAQLRDVMAPFRPFLSPKYKFFWTPVLDQAFRDSKQVIIDAIHHGVEIFDTSKPTCLRPDWSLKGIGYFLLQQHCSCKTGLPDCCQDGWRITLAGSRFLNGAEQRYAPIEGEALAIVWGLEQTKYFTQGCPNLLIITDHKPLTKIFGDRTLDEIANPRLFRLKQRSLRWYFQIAHLPGKTNCAADATSRHPCANANPSIEDCSESLWVGSIQQEAEDITSISWSRITEETSRDTILSQVLVGISEGFAHDYPAITPFMRYKDSLYAIDGVVMYNDRVVVPSTLRRPVLEGLHSAHQGVSGMELRAQAIVFWPGMTKDIHTTRNKCVECNRNAPSQAPLPSEPADPPSTPFEKIFADFLEFGGRHYLVTGDRLSGWSEIFSTPTGTSHSGARGLVACLRSLFSTFGVPEELSSDGGPEFTSSVTADFLRRWGVKHRLSSAYHPQSNGRAEVAVKNAKRLMRSNAGPSGNLDNDKLLRAMLQLRNTPDPDCNVSPAQILFGRPIRDAFSFANRLEKFSNPKIHPLWREAWESKESALRTRFTKTSEKLNEHVRQLPPLSLGDRCFVQNQTGVAPKKWDRTGIVTEVLDHDQYVVKVDGSGRVTRRNRQFLRAFKPATEAIPPLQMASYKDRIKVTQPSSSDLDQASTPVTPAVDDPDPAEFINTPPENHEPVHTMAHTPQTDPKALAQEPPCALVIQDAQPPRTPRALKRLMPHNQPGIHEHTSPMGRLRHREKP